MSNQNLTALKTHLNLVIPTPPSEALECSVDYKCDKCQDTGRIYFTEEHFGRRYETHKKCGCALERARQNKLAIIPPVFADARIETLTPNLSRHPRQAEIVPQIKANPDGNYFLGGRFGSGKTHLMWALYRHAVMNDRRTVICTLSELINEYKRFIQQSQNREELTYPRLNAEELRQNQTRYSIFLDDVDKAKPTEYVAEQVFELADAIYAFGHQLVVTTNLSATQLKTHFERADERFGGAILRRFVDKATVCEMF